MYVICYKNCKLYIGYKFQRLYNVIYIIMLCVNCNNNYIQCKLQYMYYYIYKFSTVNKANWYISTIKVSYGTIKPPIVPIQTSKYMNIQCHCFVRSWQRPSWPKRPASVAIDSAKYLLTINSPDIDNVAMNLYDIIQCHVINLLLNLYPLYVRKKPD